MERQYRIQSLAESGVFSNLRVKQPRLESLKQAAWLNLQEAMDAINLIHDNIPTKNMDDRHFAFSIMWVNCLSDLVGAFRSLQEGFIHPAAAARRTVVESVAAIVAMKIDEKDFEQFRAGKLNKPKTVTKATKVFPTLGKSYGQLTQYFTHEPFEALGRGFITHGKGGSFVLVPSVERDHALPQVMAYLDTAILAHNIATAAEWSFAYTLKEMRHWKHDKGQIRASKSPGMDAIQAGAALLEKTAEEITGRKRPRAKGGK
jgi:hypothetical protein